MKKSVKKRTFEKKSLNTVKESNQRTFPVWVVVRHTRARDIRVAVIDNDSPKTRVHALSLAEDEANEAALHYGQGSASVFKGKLVLSKDAEQPDD
jgi:hypothetical protein